MLNLRANKRKLMRQRGVSQASAKFPLIFAHLQPLVRSRDEFEWKTWIKIAVASY